MVKNTRCLLKAFVKVDVSFSDGETCLSWDSVIVSQLCTAICIPLSDNFVSLTNHQLQVPYEYKYPSTLLLSIT